MAQIRGAGTATIGGSTFEVLDGTLTGQVDEVIVESPTSNTAPAVRAYYNPVLNLSMNVIGDATGVTTLSYKSYTWNVQSAELAKAAGDFVKTSIRAVKFGQ
jgi:hypothetical protein